MEIFITVQCPQPRPHPLPPKMFWNFCRVLPYQKSNFGTGVFNLFKISQAFTEHLFHRTPPSDCFCKWGYWAPSMQTVSGNKTNVDSDKLIKLSCSNIYYLTDMLIPKLCCFLPTVSLQLNVLGRVISLWRQLFLKVCRLQYFCI